MKKLFFAFAAVAAVVSCQNKNEVEPSLFKDLTIVAEADGTKTQLSGDAVLWEQTDAISLLFNGTAPYVTTFGNTQAGETAKFKGQLPNDVSVAAGYESTGYAVYPASAMQNDGTVSFTLPSDVTPNENGSFDGGRNLSSTAISLSELVANGTTTASFKNAFSIIRFTLSDGIKDMQLSAVGGNLAGTASLEFGAEGRLVPSSWSAPATALNITPADETFTGGKVYNILVYPGTYTSISAVLTDTDGCTYNKTISGNYVFEASNYYQFTFATKFEKEYTFTATGATFAQGAQIQTVFGDLHSEVLTAAADAKFTGKLPAAVVHANTAGYAIYPASAYSAGHISYTLDPVSPAELYSAALLPTSTSVAFNSVASALAKLQFTVPEGVESVTLASTKPFVGAAEMTVADGKLTAGTGNVSEFTTTSTGIVTINVYPFSAASFTVTLTDAAGAKIEQTVSNVSVAAGQTQTLAIDGNISFDKDGNFTHEGFDNGGSYEL